MTPTTGRRPARSGKVGVPIAHLGHMTELLDGIPVAQMNTSMTINATAPWLLGCYVANADLQGAERSQLQGTTQNDLVKEYLSRGTYIFPPAESLRCTVDLVTYTVREVPKWNPINVCSYHLQEAGATPMQEVAYALATAVAVLDAVRRLGPGRPRRRCRRWSAGSASLSTPAFASWRRRASCGRSRGCGTASAPSATA